MTIYEHITLFAMFIVHTEMKTSWTGLICTLTNTTATNDC